MSEEIRDIECEQAVRMVLEYLDNELRAHDHHALEKHIEKCRACFSRVEFEKRLKGLVKAAPETEAPPALLQRIRKITGEF